MPFKISQTKIPEVLVVEPEVFGDSRGFFLETYHHKKYAEKGIEESFVQDNHSRSSRGILRVPRQNLFMRQQVKYLMWQLI